jgi:NADH-quinone oxidoreductase subunit E
MGANVMTDDFARSEVEKILAAYDRRRQNLIPMLQDVQDRLGYLAEDAVFRLADYLELSPNDVFGVATFYAQFRFHPPGKHHLKVCQGTACHVRGSGLIAEAVTRKLGIGPGETSADLQFSMERVACFGSCALAPVVVIDDKVYGRMTPRKTEKLIEGFSK